MAEESWTTRDLARVRDALTSMAPAADDSERTDRIRLLEELRGAVAAAQAVETASFVSSQRTTQRAQGVPEKRIGRGIAAQVALARRESPHRAQRYCGFASILTTELPYTLHALRTGQTTEWRATLVARETAWLSREHRAIVDAELGPRIEGLAERQVESEAKKLAYRLDPYGYTRRLAAAEAERHVGLRPAPDCMSRLGALLPVAQGVAAHAALTRGADSAIATGDPRSRGQIMADLLVERITGQSHAGDVPVQINLVMTDAALLGDSLVVPTDPAEQRGSTPAPQPADGPHEPRSDALVIPLPVRDFGAGGPHGAVDDGGVDEPGVLIGYGPLPAAWARQLIARASDATPMWIRRLFRTPGSSQLAAMDSSAREFSANQRHFLTVRGEGVCATAWCSAPVRHADHIRPVDHGGRTVISNGQGLCAACNHAKQAPGWSSRPRPDGGIEITTPTGHTYVHAPPGAPRPIIIRPPTPLDLHYDRTG